MACKNVTRPLILCSDFHHKSRVQTDGDTNGKLFLHKMLRQLPTLSDHPKHFLKQESAQCQEIPPYTTSSIQTKLKEQQ